MAPIVLASGSRYRARLLDEAGIVHLVDPPEVDERAADPLLTELGAAGLALHLARAKAAAVAPRHPGARILAADQVGVLTGPDGTVRMLTKQPTEDGAVAQLLEMSGTTHDLVNGVVVMDTRTGGVREGVDTCTVTMHRFGEAEARAYVRAFTPFDTAGSYRLEDDAGLVRGVEAEDPSGVLGLPLPLLRRLLGS